MRRAAVTLHSAAGLNATVRNSLQLRSFVPQLHGVRRMAPPMRISPARSYSQKKREDVRYGEEEYWNKRYSEEAFLTFDWYQNYVDLAPILKKHIPKSARVLVAGCGNAVLSDDMVKDGYQDILNIDYSPVLIDALKFKNKQVPQLKYQTVDARNMTAIADESFDAAIDKGLVDAMVCAPEGASDVIKMLREMHRVLKPGGNFVLVTYGFPLTRMPAFMERGMNWSVNCWVLPKPYSGRWMADKFPSPIPMEIPNWIRTKKEDYEETVNFVYVATKR